MHILRDALHDDDAAVRGAALSGLHRATEGRACLAAFVGAVRAAKLTPELLVGREPCFHERPPTIRRSSLSRAPLASSTSTRSTARPTSDSSASDGATLNGSPAVGGAKPCATLASRSTRSSTVSSSPPPSHWTMSLGYRLLLRALAHPDGLEALVGSGWVAAELRAWRRAPRVDASAAPSVCPTSKCDAYTSGVEMQLAAALQPIDEIDGLGGGHGAPRASSSVELSSSLPSSLAGARSGDGTTTARR